MNSTIAIFHRLLMTSLVTVFILISLGGIVRSTGSGMGCPDWPKCFGQYIPPTSEAQLPTDYKTRYSVKGKKVATFSPFKTWVEYTNRLFGVWTGFITLAVAIFAFKFRRTHKSIFWYSQAALLMVIFNGWLGSKVVSSHLAPGIITLHMLLAMILVFILLQLKSISGMVPSLKEKFEGLSKYKKIVLGLCFIVFIQIILGTQVREQIDFITNTEPNLARSNWLDRLDWVFYVHRSFTVVILLMAVYIIRNLREVFNDDAYGSGLLIKIMMILFAEIGFGVILGYFSFPAFAQPLHLLLAIMLVSYVYEMFVYLASYGKESNVAL